ncbi:hypothetical protein GGR56DRAFT_665411 [Xylariaceae sp. FL0804]|nr:hypothetical protein GGR56DRAFT_665411 [Xylariaceae sp. FL0804]
MFFSAFSPRCSLQLMAAGCLALVVADSQTYDFIVVGGGTAGLAVATRISQYLTNSSVLVIEAGPDGRDVPDIYLPGEKGSTLGSRYDWNFTTVPQPYADNRTLAQNRGRVLGGSSALNLLSYDRGVEADFDAWQELGNDGWNWKSMHAAMESAETFQLTSVEGEAGIAVAGGVGDDGPIHFLVDRFNPPQQKLFFPTMRNLGLEETYTFLDGDMIGYMRHTSNVLNKNYTRSYSPAFLARAGSNLHLKLDTTVAKVNLEKGDSCKATGVTLVDGTVITAKKEVILSAGSVQSPQLLELSGIGNKTVLSAAGVEPVVDLPSVGENLQDHVKITTSYQLKPNYTSDTELSLNATFAAEQLADWKKNVSGFYDDTSSGCAYMNWEQAGYSQSYFVSLAKRSMDASNPIDRQKFKNLEDLSRRVPQLEIIFDDGYLGVKGYPNASSRLYGKQFMTFIASVNHAFSRGHTHIGSADVGDPPRFDPRYLSAPYDAQAVALGARYLRRLANTEPIRTAWASEYEPGVEAVSTDAEWVAYARSNCETIWHPMGTCAMLPRADGGVVSARLEVYGVENLRVVDASVMPILISGHIQTATYGIAERAAKMVAERWS